MAKRAPFGVTTVLFAGLFIWPLSSVAVQPEDGPMYLTDSHGAAGVVRAMLSLAEADPDYLSEC